MLVGMEEDEDVSMEGTVNGAVEPKELVRGFEEAYARSRDGADTEGGGDEDEEEDDEDYDAFDPRAYPEEMQRQGLLPTGCCYDDRMKLHANADYGTNGYHPEDPARIEEIFKTFKKAGLIFTGSEAEILEVIRTSPTKYMWRIQAREATRDEICLVHTKPQYAWVQSLTEMSTVQLRELTRQLDQGRDSLYVGSMTYEAALVSAGGAIETCMAVVRGDVKNAFAVIRPPGHHAESHKSMGFCIFNNVPIAARVCREQFPDACRKVLILDWDVHHGNGIQHLFYSDPNVLYISLHVYQNGEFYPSRGDNPMDTDGNIDKCGSGPGLGRNVNIGWHDQGMGDAEYMAAFQRIVMPIAHEFDPDLVIISAGFDAAAGDSLGGCFVSPECYAHMTHMLMSLAGGKVAVCLEGGYNLRAISHSALAVARTLMGEPPPRMDPQVVMKLNRQAALVLAQVQAYQAPYWQCMRPGIVDVQEVQQQGGERLHDVIRESQRLRLQQKLGMVPLFIQRDVLYKSFENQVLVTPGIHLARHILVIIHDPPELLAQPDPLDNSVAPHNAWLNDGVQEYIDWAATLGFGIMDINVPHYVTLPEDTDSFTPKFTEHPMIQQIQDIVGYIWDNYLQLYDAGDIFLMGVGNAYLGVKSLLVNRDSKHRISGVVNFVTGNLRPVRSEADPELSAWYKNNSRVFVGNQHACWKDAQLSRKVGQRRYGDVRQSPVDGLNRMMRHHADEAQAWILSRRASPSSSHQAVGPGPDGV